jgi:hypothetical protein
MKKVEGVDIGSLNKGSLIDLETKSRHYRIEYLGEGKGFISGHPILCPTPVLARLQGSTCHPGIVDSQKIRQGMHLVFRRLEDRFPVTTSEIMAINIVDQAA